MDLVVKEGLSLQEAVAEAGEKARQVKEEGVDQAALDAAAAKGFGNALSEYDEDEMNLVVEELYPQSATYNSPVSNSIISKLRENRDSPINA